MREEFGAIVALFIIVGFVFAIGRALGRHRS
jgi:LPS O-antigen subunit length determinant protein (WzzB/FepE family)